MTDLIVDGRGLEPPEPMERVLEALDSIGPGERIRFVMDRDPVPLYRILDMNGYRHATEYRDDGTVEVLIWLK